MGRTYTTATVLVYMSDYKKTVPHTNWEQSHQWGLSWGLFEIYDTISVWEEHAHPTLWGRVDKMLSVPEQGADMESRTSAVVVLGGSNPPRNLQATLYISFMLFYNLLNNTWNLDLLEKS